MKNTVLILFTISLLFFCNSLFAFLKLSNQPNSGKNDSLNHLSVNIASTNDIISNFKGGLNQKSQILSLFNFKVDFESLKIPGFSASIHLIKTGNRKASEEFIGDLQMVSNIEGKSNRFIYEVWISQSIKKFQIKAGLHDLNSVFMASESSSEFINSSFGVMPTLSINQPVSIFPVTTFGAILIYNHPKYEFNIGTYNLNNDFIDEENFSLRNHFYHLGHLLIAELSLKHNFKGNYQGDYKFGFYHRNYHGSSTKVFEIKQREINQGFYILFDQIFYRKTDINLFTFLQLSYDNGLSSQINFYRGGGILMHLNRYKREFKLGLGVASMKFNTPNGETSKNETALEIKSEIQINSFIGLSPEIQYIISPSGIYKNSLLGLLRVFYQFETEMLN